MDSSAVIYLVERIAPYADLLDPVWSAAERGQIQLISSALVLIEVLVKPLCDQNTVLCDVYRDALLRSHEFRLVEVDEVIAERAARIRAYSNLRTPDATHAAAALQSGAGLFITNDPAFRRVNGLPVALLSDYVASAPE
ncbi:MAG: PIN domain-containing protein [Planctomycetota bacterium]